MTLLTTTTRRRISLLITDWDETVTLKDTLHLVAQAAYDHKPEFSPKWEYFGDHYMKDLADFAQQYKDKNPATPEKNGKNALERKINYLDQLRHVEMQSINRIEDSRLFHEVSEAQIRAQHRHVQVRPYFFDVLQRALANDIPVCIVSVNWSAALMKEVLHQNGFDTSKVQIYANDVVMDIRSGVGTGKLSKSEAVALRTGIDKVRVIHEIVEKYKSANPAVTDQIFYFGDSNTDLPGLLEVNTGVIMDNPRLKAVFESELGIPVCELGQGDAEDVDPKTNRIYYVNGWKQVLDNWI
ncbi:HAD-like protein [Nadsonia fulvescens var. elongata DSM 6958]|uniref:HAD-like protein n=1 Tax=Nadsonia fulvescens var. elongata DSM 6958 TaxID=857566 RepID=A0A1E3PG95_9ASCO|nr:HAD-like protein [Nadsonia fulvescens var. elongata DSM 6958]